MRWEMIVNRGKQPWLSSFVKVGIASWKKETREEEKKIKNKGSEGEGLCFD